MSHIQVDPVKAHVLEEHRMLDQHIHRLMQLLDCGLWLIVHIPGAEPRQSRNEIGAVPNFRNAEVHWKGIVQGRQQQGAFRMDAVYCSLYHILYHGVLQVVFICGGGSSGTLREKTSLDNQNRCILCHICNPAHCAFRRCMLCPLQFT